MKTSPLAKDLRRRCTWAEKLLWKRLRGRRLAGAKFRRQHPIGPYVLDFYCAELRYAIELDGSEHGFPERHVRDRTRDRYLASHGIRLKRVWNFQLRENEEGVIEAIRRELAALAHGTGAAEERNPHPGPPPAAQGEGDTAASAPWPCLQGAASAEAPAAAGGWG